MSLPDSLFAPSTYFATRGPPSLAAAVAVVALSGVLFVLGEATSAALTGAALDGPAAPTLTPAESFGARLVPALAFGTAVGLLWWIAASALLAPLVALGELDFGESAVVTPLLMAWGFVPPALAIHVAVLLAAPSLTTTPVGGSPYAMLWTGPGVLVALAAVGWQTAIWAHGTAAAAGISPKLTAVPCGAVSALGLYAHAVIV